MRSWAIALALLGCSSAEVVDQAASVPAPISQAPPAPPEPSPPGPHLVGQTQAFGRFTPSTQHPLAARNNRQVVDLAGGAVVAEMDADGLRWLSDGRLLGIAGESATIWQPLTGASASGVVPAGAEVVSAVRIGDLDYVGWRLDKKVSVRRLDGAGETLTIDDAWERQADLRLTPLGAIGVVVTGSSGPLLGIKLDGSEIFREQVAQGVQASPNGERILFSSGQLRVAPDFAVAHTFAGRAKLDPTGARIAAEYGDGVELFDIATSNALSFATTGPAQLSWNADGSRFAFFSRADELLVWPVAEPKPTIWATLPGAHDVQLVGEVAIVKTYEGTTAVGGTGKLAETGEKGCTFTASQNGPLIGLCAGEKSVRFEKDSFKTSQLPWGEPVTVQFNERLGLRVVVAAQERLFSKTGPPAGAPTAASPSLGHWWEVAGEPQLEIAGKTISVVIPETGQVQQKLDIALGEDIVGAKLDGDGAVYAWGKRALVRHGLDNKQRWKVKLPEEIRLVQLAAKRVVVNVAGKTLADAKLQVLAAADGKLQKEMPSVMALVSSSAMAVVATQGDPGTIYDLETFEVLLAASGDRLSPDGTWRIDLGAHRQWGSGIMRRKGFKVVNLRTKAVTLSFDEPFDHLVFSRDSARLLVKTADSKLVALEVTSGKELARQPVPGRFEIKSLVTSDVVLGTVDQDWLLVRLDDGRRLRVSASSKGTTSRVTLYDDQHYSGDADGPVLLYRGGGWLSPELVPLAQAPDRHRPELLAEFLTKR